MANVYGVIKPEKEKGSCSVYRIVELTKDERFSPGARTEILKTSVGDVIAVGLPTAGKMNEFLAAAEASIGRYKAMPEAESFENAKYLIVKRSEEAKRAADEESLSKIETALFA